MTLVSIIRHTRSTDMYRRLFRGELSVFFLLGKCQGSDVCGLRQLTLQEPDCSTNSFDIRRACNSQRFSLFGWADLFSLVGVDSEPGAFGQLDRLVLMICGRGSGVAWRVGFLIWTRGTGASTFLWSLDQKCE